MPVAGQVIVQVVIIFMVVALLALVLRWAFGRDRNAPPIAWPKEAGDREADYGLLAAAATVVSEDEASRIRQMLGLAGIKATTTRDPASGRWKVLVFSSELHRARRVAGGSP